MRISIFLGGDRNLSRLSSWICSGDARRDIRQKQRARRSAASSPGERAMDVVASNVVAATVMAGWAAVISVVGVQSPGNRPPPSAASVESLFAPCLVRVRQPPRLDQSFAPYDAPLSIPAPTPKAPGMTDEPAVAARPSVDVEATGSVASGRDRLQRRTNLRLAGCPGARLPRAPLTRARPQSRRNSRSDPLQAASGAATSYSVPTASPCPSGLR